jgi:polar amino acid transport system permease protein
VWLFWVFYALPMLPHMPRLPPTTAAIVVLTMIGTAYGSEIVRSGIEAVQRDQLDACHALGLGKLQSLKYVIVPQALSQIVPAFASLAADMVKWTSILSFVGVQDMLYVANNVRSNTFQTVSVFSLLAIAYWLLCLASSAAFRALERILPLNRALKAAHAGAQPSFEPLLVQPEGVRQ